MPPPWVRPSNNRAAPTLATPLPVTPPPCTLRTVSLAYRYWWRFAGRGGAPPAWCGATGATYMKKGLGDFRASLYGSSTAGGRSAACVAAMLACHVLFRTVLDGDYGTLQYAVQSRHTICAIN